MTHDDEPRFCIHCGNRIARDGDGNWTYTGWALDDRIPDGIGLDCPTWEPGQLREEVDVIFHGMHFPGILIADYEEAGLDA